MLLCLRHYDTQKRVKIDEGLNALRGGGEELNNHKRASHNDRVATTFVENLVPSHVPLSILLVDSVIYVTFRSV